ncbi:glycosyltransferase family 2 protein [Agrococcus sp. Marseille-P2731]|uniref:glycosyltransferase family 2 protein n=1 Tax=Agrococcus sp. Marseille-P2731 TaxID=1841862 RepID=UPI0009313124|nr:galactosyltransferase-related protein [Agrococcus sp. Marseille-P2731]
MTIATITLASRARLAHLAQQQARLQHVTGLERIVVWLDAEAPPAEVPATHVQHVPPDPGGMRLAAARNVGARTAIELGCDRLVFLDADCVPGEELLPRYDDALRARPHGLLAGPVTYLPESVAVTPSTDLAALTAPHAARPSPAEGAVQDAEPEQQLLFWSLSFAVTAGTWQRIGGFDEAYVGYGAEDTDFAMRSADASARLAWVGGAHAYHQYHPTSSPPWQHLDDILRNGGLFAERWGFWPMLGWLEAFEREGAVERVGDGWRRARGAR